MGWLEPRDLERFAADGFLVVPGALPEDRLRVADAEVDELVATTPPTSDGAGHDATQWFLPPARLPACEALYRGSPAEALARELVAPLGLAPAFDHVQVATTVPPWSHVPGGPHIDGHGALEDPIASFTLLAGIALTDQLAPSCGNLWVWPGSHVVHASLLRARGAAALRPTFGHSTLLSPPAEVGAPVELRMGRGDLLLAHYLLGHNKGGNTTQVVRRSVYLRLRADGHEARQDEALTDELSEFAPVRAAVERAGLRSV